LESLGDQQLPRLLLDLIELGGHAIGQRVDPAAVCREVRGQVRDLGVDAPAEQVQHRESDAAHHETGEGAWQPQLRDQVYQRVEQKRDDDRDQYGDEEYSPEVKKRNRGRGSKNADARVDRAPRWNGLGSLVRAFMIEDCGVWSRPQAPIDRMKRMSPLQFNISVAVVPVTTIIIVLIGVLLNSGTMNRRYDDLKDLIKACAERHDANERRMEETLSASFTRVEEALSADFARVEETMNANFSRVEKLVSTYIRRVVG
jgi:hypothetical protein